MSAGPPKDAPPRQAIPKGLVIDTELVAPIVIPVVKQLNGKKASKKRVAETAEVEKDLLAGEPLPIPAAATDPKEAEIDKSAVPEEFEVNVDARRSAEYRSLPEEVRVRGDAFLRNLERSRVALIPEKDLLELAQPFFREHEGAFTQQAQTSLVRTTYNKWTVVRQRVRRKLFQLFRHHSVVDMSWLTDERAICLAARLFLRDNEVVPTEQEVKRVRGLLQNYLDPEQQRVVTRLLKETASPRGGMREQEGLM